MHLRTLQKNETCNTKCTRRAKYSNSAPRKANAVRSRPDLMSMCLIRPYLSKARSAVHGGSRYENAGCRMVAIISRTYPARLCAHLPEALRCRGATWCSGGVKEEKGGRKNCVLLPLHAGLTPRLELNVLRVLLVPPSPRVLSSGSTFRGGQKTSSVGTTAMMRGSPWKFHVWEAMRVSGQQAALLRGPTLRPPPPP